MASYTGKFFKEREDSGTGSGGATSSYTGKFFTEKEGGASAPSSTSVRSAATKLTPAPIVLNQTSPLAPTPIKSNSKKIDTRTQYEKLLDDYSKENIWAGVDDIKKGGIGNVLWGGVQLLGSALQQPQSWYLNAQMAAQSKAKGLPYKYLPNLDAGKTDALIGAMNNKKGYLQQAKEFNPVVGGIAEFGVNIMTDPLSFVAGGEVDDIVRASRSVRAGGVAQSSDDLARAASRLTPKELKPTPISDVELWEARNTGLGLGQYFDMPDLDDVAISARSAKNAPLTPAAIDTAADVAQTARSVDLTPPPLTQAARRAADAVDEAGTRIRGLSQNVATDLNMDPAIRQSFTDTPETYKQIANAATLKKAEDIMSQGYGAAYDDLMTAINTSKMKPEHVPLARMVANQAAQAGDFDTARKVIATTAEKLTEAGQLSQAAKILRKSDPMTVADVAERIVKKINDEGIKKIRNWQSVKGITDGELKMLSQIDIGDEKAITDALSQIGKRIASEIPSTFGEKLDEFRRIAMLANPKTQARNFFGNVPLALERKASDRLSALAQQFIPAEKRTSALIVDQNSKNIAKQLYEQSADALKGTDKWDMRRIVGQNRQIFDMHKFSPTSAVNFFLPDEKKLTKPIIEKVREFTYALMEAGDEPFLKSAFQDRAASYIAAQGYKSLDEVPQAVIDLASSEALKATFKDASAAAQWINKTKRQGGAFGKAADVILPFTTTPINITRRALDYSPAGIAKGLAKIRKPIEAAEWIDDVAKGIVGTGVIGLGAAAAMNGIITGPADSNSTRAAFDRATGKQNFTVTTPVGSVDYSWAQPFGSQLAIGAATYQAVKNGATPLEALNGAAQAFGDTIISSSVYQNVLDLFEGYGSPTERIMQNTAGDFAQQLIPASLGQIARTADPTVRTTYEKGDFFGTQANMTAAKIPGLSQTLPESVDVWGRTNTRIQNPIGRAANELLNPASLNITKTDTVSDEVRRLGGVTGDTSVYPKVAPYSFSQNKTTYTLSAADRAEFQRVMGQQAYSKIAALMKTSGYKQVTDAAQARAIKRIIDESYDYAKAQYIRKQK